MKLQVRCELVPWPGMTCLGRKGLVGELLLPEVRVTAGKELVRVAEESMGTHASDASMSRSYPEQVGGGGVEEEWQWEELREE